MGPPTKTWDLDPRFPWGTPSWLRAAKVVRKDQRRTEMALRLARFPDGRRLEACECEAQPSIDLASTSELATCLCSRTQRTWTSRSSPAGRNAAAR